MFGVPAPRFPGSQPAGVCISTSLSALQEVCLGSMGFFSLAFLFHLQPELPLTNYSWWCHVKELLQHPPAGTSVCECIMYIMQAGLLCEAVCYASVCVCCNTPSKSKSQTAALMPAASQVMKGCCSQPQIPPSPPSSPVTPNQSRRPLAALYPRLRHV